MNSQKQYQHTQILPPFGVSINRPTQCNSSRPQHPYRLQIDKNSDNLNNYADGFRCFLAEFSGTFLFAYLGQCAITSFELIGTQNDSINRLSATIFVKALAYMFGILVSFKISGAHLNPAYSLSCAIYGLIRYRRAFSMITAQYLASFLSSILLHITYYDKLTQRHTEGQLGRNNIMRSHGNLLSTGKFFSSFPPTEISLFQLTTSYLIANCYFAFLILAIQEGKLMRISKQLKPLYLAASLILIVASFSANGGPVLNPAQDFAPRFYILISGWGTGAFNLYQHNYWWLCGILVPHLGAIIGFGLYKLVASMHNKNPTMIVKQIDERLKGENLDSVDSYEDNDDD